MKWKNLRVTVLVGITLVSLGFNGYSFYNKPPKETNPTTKELVQTIGEISIQSNSESGVQGESVEELKKIIYKLPQVEKKLAFIKGVITEGNTVYLDLDEVEWFGGEAAEIAAKEDGVLEPESLPNGFYIRNASEEIKRVKLEPDVTIAELNGARHQQVDYTSIVSEELMDRLFHLTFVEGKVVLLEEQYRP